MSCPGVSIVGRRGESSPYAHEIDAQPAKDLPRCPFDVEKAEQDMLGLDLLVVAAQREPRRSLQGAFGPVGELKIAKLADSLSGDRLGNLVP